MKSCKSVMYPLSFVKATTFFPRIIIGNFIPIIFSIITAPICFYLLFKTEHPWLSVLIPLIAFLFFILLYYPSFSYYTILLFIPLGLLRHYSLEMRFLSISKVLGILAIFIVIGRILFIRGELSRIRSNYIILIMFISISILSILNSNFPLGFQLNELRMLMQSVFFAFLTLYFIHNPSFFKISAILISSGSFINSIFTISSIFLTSSGDVARAVGTNTDANFNAAVILFSIPYLAFLFKLCKSNLIKILLTFVFILDIYAIILTYSRSMIILTTITLLITFLVNFKKISLNKAGILFIILFPFIIFGSLKITETQLYKRMLTLLTPQTDISLSRRGMYIPIAFKAISEKPILGHGIGTFPFVYSESQYAVAYYSMGKGGNTKQGFFRSAHNTYLEILTGSGILGLSSFLFLLLFSIMVFFKYSRNSQLCPEIRIFYSNALIAFIQILIAFMTASSPYHKYIWYNIGLAMVSNTSLLLHKNSLNQRSEKK